MNILWLIVLFYLVGGNCCGTCGNNCGCDDDNCCSWLWIIILLALVNNGSGFSLGCNSCGSSFFGRNGSGCNTCANNDCDCGCNPCGC